MRMKSGKKQTNRQTARRECIRRRITRGSGEGKGKDRGRGKKIMLFYVYGWHFQPIQYHTHVLLQCASSPLDISGLGSAYFGSQSPCYTQIHVKTFPLKWSLSRCRGVIRSLSFPGREPGPTQVEGKVERRGGGVSLDRITLIPRSGFSGSLCIV